MADPNALPDIKLPITCEEDYKRGSDFAHRLMQTPCLTSETLAYMDAVEDALAEWEDSHPTTDESAWTPSPSLESFLALARDQEADTDLAHSCRLLAENACHAASYLDERALLGYAEFLGLAHFAPEEAIRLLKGD